MAAMLHSFHYLREFSLASKKALQQGIRAGETAQSIPDIRSACNGVVLQWNSKCYSQGGRFFPAPVSGLWAAVWRALI